MSRKKRKRDNPRRNRWGLSLAARNRSGQGYAARLQAAVLGIGPLLKRNRATVKACLIFAVSIVAFMLLYSWLTGSGSFDEFRRFTAEATGFVLNLFGGDVLVAGTQVSSSGFTMGIIEACTGVVPMIIFVSAVLAYPSSVRQKVLAIALGVLGLYAVNLVRTSTLFVVGTHFPGFFDTAHYLVWQSLMILAAVVFWLLWVMRFAHAPPD